MARVRKHLSRVGVAAAVWFAVAIALIPFVFMLTTSLKPRGAAQTVPPKWLFSPTFENYEAVLGGNTQLSEAFLPLLGNSIIVAVASTALALALGLPAAYALTLRRFGPRRFLAKWFLSVIMFPPVVAVIPLFIFAGKLQLIDTYPVLIVPYVAFNLPIVIWILRSSILQIPTEIAEAALIDGYTRVGALWKVILPLALPGIATAAILSMILSWNEFLFALTLTRSFVKTAPVGVQEFTGMFGTDWGNLTAASTIIVAPILVMTLMLRRRLISGLTLGAVK